MARFTAARVFCVCAIGRVARVAAGFNWTSRTTSAPWGPRAAHTTVIDAAGAVYVLGGYFDYQNIYYLSEVWASTDGGVRETGLPRVHGGGGGYERVRTGTNGY
jgi:hypothetical protein